MFEQIDNNESCMLKRICAPRGKETIDQQESILLSAVTSSPVATYGPCRVIVKSWIVLLFTFLVHSYDLVTLVSSL